MIDPDDYFIDYESDFDDDEDSLEGAPHDPFVLDCGNPDCCMPAGHFLSECFTAEDMKIWMEELENE